MLVFHIRFTLDVSVVVCPILVLIYLQYFTRCGALRSSLTNIVTDYFNTFTYHTKVFHGIIVIYFNQGTLMVTHFSQLTTVGANENKYINTRTVRECMREQKRQRMREQKREHIRERVREQLDLLGHLWCHRRHAAGTHDGRCAVVRKAVRHYFCNR